MSPKDGQWGAILPNGTVTGMIGMVARHEADMAIDEITVTRKFISSMKLKNFNDFRFSQINERISLISVILIFMKIQES